MIFNRQFAVFVVGGALSAFIDIGVMQVLILSGIANLTATTIGFFLGLLFNYTYHSKMTFKAKMSLLFAFRFCFVVAINYLITIFMVFMSYHFFKQSAFIGKAISLPVVAVNGYILSKVWVFKR